MRPLLVTALVLATSACGETLYPGLGDEPVDETSVEVEETSGGADAPPDSAFVPADASTIDSEPAAVSDAAEAVETGTPILASNPGQVYCDVGGVKNVLCPAGQTCCGKQPPFGSFSWSCSSGSCDAPALGLSRTYRCNEKADCGGFVCCVDRGLFGAMNGTKCHGDTSPCGDETACMSDADCPSGLKCAEATVEDGDFAIGMCK